MTNPGSTIAMLIVNDPLDELTVFDPSGRGRQRLCDDPGTGGFVKLLDVQVQMLQSFFL